MRTLARIIDANANRAREGLRVMEDAARFALDDGGLSAGLKGLRHDLRAALDGLGFTRAWLALERDTPGDVGAVAGGGTSRGGVRDVAVAAGARAGEALRSIEEAVKGLGRDAGAVAAIRYRLYELERRLLGAMGSGLGRQWTLCVIVTESLCVPHGWMEVARRAMEGGADCVQLREKALGSRELLARARALVEVAHARGVCVIVNDRADLAGLSGADGVHVGREDVAIEDARRSAGREVIVGASTSTPEEAREAVRAGADYCGIGAMFATRTKADPRVVGPGAVGTYLEDGVLACVPHLAIGGITPQNAAVVRGAGARGLAVSSCVCGSEEPEEVCRRLCEVMGRHQR